jgi:diguanylate cyclase (GGDEF)-like protein/PAS domain S-box-containing protein
MNTGSHFNINKLFIIGRKKSALIVYLFLCLFLHFSTTAFCSNNISFKRIFGENNISSNYVNDIIRRNDGFIWMATSDGLNRYDGNNFVTLHSNSDDNASLPDAWVNILLEDHHDQLWIGTANGLARLLPDERQFENYAFSENNVHSLSGKNIVNLFEDLDDNLWVATDRGLSLYQPESNDFKNFFIDPDKSSRDNNQINVIAQKNDQQLWIGNGQGLFVFDIAIGTFTKHNFPFNETIEANQEIEIEDIDIDSKGSLWLATAFQGLYKYDPQTQKVKIYRYEKNNPESIVSDNLWKIFIDKDDNIWMASWGEGIGRIDSSSGQISRHKHNNADIRSIPNNQTTGIFQDEEGLIWVTTYDGIAFYQPDNPVESIRPIPGDNNSLSSDLVWSFEETSEAIWIGTTEGINRLDKQTGTIEKFYTGNESDDLENFTALWTIVKAEKEKLWIGAESGLAQFDTKTNKLSYVYEMLNQEEISDSDFLLLQQAVWAINKNPDESIWVGTNYSNLYLIDKDFNILENYTDLIHATIAKYDNIEFTNIIPDENKNLWLATSTGFFFLNIKDKSIIPVKSLSGKDIYENDWMYAVQNHKSKPNLYLVSSQNSGLSLLKFNLNGTVKRLLHIDQKYPNMHDKSAYSVYPVNDKDIWFTGEKNLYHLDLETKLLTNYGYNYFDHDITFHENTQYIAEDGQLYIGSNRGAIRFTPDKIKKSHFQPNVYFSAINSNSLFIATSSEKPDQTDINYTKNQIEPEIPLHQLKTLTFPYSDNTFSFNFVALDYTNNGNLFYAYKIPEIDNSWIQLRKRQNITFTNLAAGSYHLEVKATNADMEWSENTAVLDFIVLQKPWLTWWMKIIYFLLASLFLFWIFRLWRKNLLTRFALEHREVQLSQALWGSGDMLWEWNINKQEVIRTANHELINARRDFFTGILDGEKHRIHPEDIESLQKMLQEIFDGKSSELDAVYRQKNNKGEWVWLHDRAKVSSRTKDNKPLIVNGVSRNINSIKVKEERSQLIASAFQSSSDGAVILDVNLNIISINSALSKITGYDERVINKKMPKSTGAISTNNKSPKALFKIIGKAIQTNATYHNEVNITTVQGQKIPVDLRVNCIYDAKNKPTHYIATFTDMTYRKKTEDELMYLANFDSLTGLPNRSLMRIQLNQALLQAESEKKIMAIMFIDLDNFKNINDSLGHSIGDDVLIAIGIRLKSSIKKTDTIARIGSDEFTLGLLNIDSMNDVITYAEKIIQNIAKPIIIEGQELIISPSIGISLYEKSKTDIDILLKQADTAMHHAKKIGKNNFQFFSETMNKTVINRIDLEMRLRKALKNNEFILNYQPKYNLDTGKITGFESLIRWHDPINGLILPDEFIPLSEETGLILPIGDFVLNNACLQLKNWIKMGFSEMQLAINISAVQFMDKDLVEKVSQALQKHGIPAQSLEIEITESTLIEDLQYTVNTLNELRKLGVSLSLDDFGTGYSSLNYLKQFPINSLKIDRSFIVDIATDLHDAKMVESIISLAHNLCLKVIAEGVENIEQLNILKSFKLEEIQGYLISQPLTADKATHLIKTGFADSFFTP